MNLPMTFRFAVSVLLVFVVVKCLADDANDPPLIHSQPSFVMATKDVELAVTELGGHMAPVTFFRDSDKPVQPYYISPWQGEPPSAMPAPVLVRMALS